MLQSQWKTRLLARFKQPDGEYPHTELNAMVMALPPGDASMEALRSLQTDADTTDDPSEVPAPKSKGGADYKILGVDISLRDYMQAAFIDTLSEPLALPILTLPVYITKDRLETLEEWDDWKTLRAFLASHGLQPVVVFKNAPVVLPSLTIGYLSDIRVGFTTHD